MLYLNNASTCCPEQKVLDDYIWCLKNHWHNPSDQSQQGIKAKEIINEARQKIAKIINAEPDEIYFTSGATESNNWAIKGFAESHPNCTVFSTRVEHPSIYNVCEYLKNKGKDVYYLGVDSFGGIPLRELLKINQMLSKNYNCSTANKTILFSIHLVNNVAGTILDIESFNSVLNKKENKNLVVHVDATQGFIYEDIDVKRMGIDMLTISFHKIGGVKGGFLYVKKGTTLSPLLHGGKQFGGQRPGTEDVSAIYANCCLAERKWKDREGICDYIEFIEDYLDRKIDNTLDDITIYWNGDMFRESSKITSLTFCGVNANQLVSLLEEDGIIVSNGAACSSGTNVPDRVLKELNLTDEECFSTIRISINENTTVEDVDFFVDSLVRNVRMLKLME